VLELGASRPAEVLVCDRIEEALWGADWVQENAPQKLDLKSQRYHHVESAVTHDCIITSSTSSFTWSQLGAGSPISRRWNSESSCERATECRLGFVADIVGHVQDLSIRGSRRAAAHVYLEHRRQPAKKQALCVTLATEIAAADPCHGSIATPLLGRYFSFHELRQQPAPRKQLRGRPLPQPVSVAVREDNDVSRREHHVIVTRSASRAHAYSKRMPSHCIVDCT
jgi:hypothetical protein